MYSVLQRISGILAEHGTATAASDGSGLEDVEQRASMFWNTTEGCRQNSVRFLSQPLHHWSDWRSSGWRCGIKNETAWEKREFVGKSPPMKEYPYEGLSLVTYSSVFVKRLFCFPQPVWAVWLLLIDFKCMKAAHVSGLFSSCPAHILAVCKGKAGLSLALLWYVILGQQPSIHPGACLLPHSPW